MILAATVITMFMQAAISTSDLPDGYPPFPERLLQDYPSPIGDIEYDRNVASELKSLSDHGDGYATLILSMIERCNENDDDCNAAKLLLLQKSHDQGEAMASVFIRQIRLERDPSTAEKIRPASRVCGLTTDDLPDLSDWMNGLEFPIYFDQPQPFARWRVKDASGERGADAIIFTTDHVSVYLVFRNGELKIVRALSGFDVRSVEQWNAIVEFNRRFAKRICPSWEGLGDAINHYIEKVGMTWPPGWIHFEGDGAWLAAGGVAPDFFVFDLYVDPLHEPFNARGYDEEFDTSEGVLLKMLQKEPSN